MLLWSENLLFVWEPDDLVMSQHAHCHLKQGKEKFSKKSVVVGQKILISKELHNCSIINN